MRFRTLCVGLAAAAAFFCVPNGELAEAGPRRFIVPNQAVKATINGREYFVEVTVGYRMMGILPAGSNLQPMLETTVRFRSVNGRPVAAFEPAMVNFEGRGGPVLMNLYRTPTPLALPAPGTLELRGSASGALATGSLVAADISVQQGRKTYRVRVPNITVRANIAP